MPPKRRAFGDVKNQRILLDHSATKSQKPQQHQPQQPSESSVQKPAPEPEKPTIVTKTQSATETKKANNDENLNLGQVPNKAYDPRIESYPMDEALFMKVALLELADDGLPPPHVLDDEPFDF